MYLKKIELALMNVALILLFLVMTTVVIAESYSDKSDTSKVTAVKNEKKRDKLSDSELLSVNQELSINQESKKEE